MVLEGARPWGRGGSEFAEKYFELTMRFIAHTDTDENYFGINYLQQMQTKLLFAVLTRLHRRYRYREILFLNDFRYEFGR